MARIYLSGINHVPSKASTLQEERVPFTLYRAFYSLQDRIILVASNLSVEELNNYAIKSVQIDEIRYTNQ